LAVAFLALLDCAHFLLLTARRAACTPRTRHGMIGQKENAGRNVTVAPFI